MRPTDLLTLTPQGLYCPPGDFHIDPVRPVSRALITHGHSDHARPGHENVIATRETLAIMGIRMGAHFAQAHRAVGYGEVLKLGGTKISFHPAGHVLGSAQILIEMDGLRIVNSGDYKRARDPTCAGFQPIACDVFITEATFGLPVFRHPDAAGEIAKLIASRNLFPERAHLVGAYALGKAQRVVMLLREAGYDRPVYVHGAMDKSMDYYASQGVALGDIRKVAANDRAKLGGEIILCPPGALQDLWSRKFPDPVTALASGWMRVRARARQRGVVLPLVISDHCDWPELLASIRDTGCREIWVTHGAEEGLIHWATAQGLAARPLNMIGYGDEADEAAA